jgi:hypothetical protein
LTEGQGQRGGIKSRNYKFSFFLLKMEIGVKPSIRYVKIKSGYKRSLPLTKRKAVSGSLGVPPTSNRRLNLTLKTALLLY